MTRLAQWTLCLAAILPVWVVRAALAQSAPASMADVAVRNFPPTAYQADRQNWAAAEDNRGILYFGNTNGVLEFDGTRWRLIALPDGGGAFALGKSADGRILVGGQGEVGWLASDASGSMVYVSKSSGLPDAFRSSGEPVIQILDAPIGQVFLSDHWLFIRPATGALMVLRSGDHFLHAAWFNDALYVLDSGRGLMRLDAGALRNVAGGADMRGLTMLATASGLLIPSYDKGLMLYVPGSANPWQSPHDNDWSVEDNAGVTSAVALNDHLLALGTAKHGVALIDLRDGAVQRLDAELGLADPHVYSLAYDDNGNLWLATANGISLFSLSLPEGPLAAPFNAWARSVTGTRDEHLIFGGTYFAAPGGIQQLSQDSAQELRFPFNYNAFRFDYSADGLKATGEMEFQTYVRGVDDRWTDWSTRSEREFTQLSPGTWVFKVRARKPDGEISGEGTYQFTIRPAWYNTWWFTVFEIFFVLGLMLLPGHTPHERVQEILTSFAAIVPCVYIGNWAGTLISHYIASSVALVNILVSSLLSLAINPIQEKFRDLVKYRNRRRAKHRDLKTEHKRMLREHEEMERRRAEEELKFAKEEQEFAKEEQEFVKEEQEYKEELAQEREERKQEHKKHKKDRHE